MTGLEYIRQYYGVPAYAGVRVKVQHGGEVREGVILQKGDNYLRVKIDGEKHPLILHPTDGVTYLIERNYTELQP